MPKRARAGYSKKGLREKIEKAGKRSDSALKRC